MQFVLQEAFKAFHKESAYIDKFKKTVRIGRVKDGQTDGQEELRKDFEELRQKAIAMVSLNVVCFDNNKYELLPVCLLLNCMQFD
jgi:cytochrome b involved in lipid metabolism